MARSPLGAADGADTEPVGQGVTRGPDVCAPDRSGCLVGGARYTQESTHWFQQAQEWGVSAPLVLGENLICDIGSGRRVSAVAATVHAPCVSEAVCAVRRGRARVGGRWVPEGPGRAVGLRPEAESGGRWAAVALG